VKVFYSFRYTRQVRCRTKEIHMIRKVNPIAKALLQSRKRTQVVPDKKKYNRKKHKEKFNAETRNRDLSKDSD